MKSYLLLCISLLVFGCSSSQQSPDASGAFEARDYLLSSEVPGILQSFAVEEGQKLESGAFIGYVDTLPLLLKRDQLQAQFTAITGRKPSISTQLAALEAQYRHAVDEQARVERLVKQDAAPSKQLDDAKSQSEVLRQQIKALKSNLQISSNGISEDARVIEVQINQINDQIRRSKLYAPFRGTVLVKYAEEKEMAAVGKPLLRLAQLDTLILRAFFTGDQLPKIQLGDKVQVLTDATKGNSKAHVGQIEWISEQAEFTPKTIQTRDERANLVYAVKIKVANTGDLKIGMYADVKLETTQP